ncbi:hypothetical protein GCM10025866_36630 [Naasia aerilata]|nr:hypothetical protein GCM10025866_36630 [Naasia aerilata]
MNRGREALTRPVEWTLYLTHEVRLAPDCVEELIAAGEACSPAAGQVGPRLYRSGSGALWSTGGRITATGSARHRLRAAEDGRAAWLDGACVLVSEEVRRQVGGWSERFFLYWEDVEYSLRIGESRPVICANLASAEQDTGMTPIYYGARNRILLWRMRRRPLLVSTSLVRLLAVVVLRDWLWNRDYRSAHVRAVGLRHGFSEALAKGLGQVRERGSR